MSVTQMNCMVIASMLIEHIETSLACIQTNHFSGRTKIIKTEFLLVTQIIRTVVLDT